VTYWLERLHAEDLWAMEVLDWKSLTAHEGYQCLEMEQTLITGGGQRIVTTRCPIRFNGQKLVTGKPAPALGQDREKIVMEFLK
jgi:crotonobetainyl-CoA:carnitine CoA-transferase CaiB-like acyl-CoA transferase